MEKMECKTILVLAITALMLLSIGMIGPARTQATTIGIEPNKVIDLTRQAGSTFTVEVWVRDVANLAGVAFKLGYDTSILTATLVEYGGIFGGDPNYYYEWVLPPLRINDAEGWVRYGVSVFGGGSPIDGDGRVATITFTVDSYGSCPLHLYETDLGDPIIPPNPIEHTPIDGYFRNTLPGDIQGDATGTPPDGDVDYYDFLAFAAAYLKILGQPGYNIEADLQGDSPGTLPDGDVDYYDFLLFASNYLKTMP